MNKIHPTAVIDPTVVLGDGNVIGPYAVILGNWPLFWASAGLVVVGAIAGKVLSMMGLGKKAH